MIWEDVSIDHIRKRIGEGASASVISAELASMGYPVSRNAVIGKAHRMRILFIQTPGKVHLKKPRRSKRSNHAAQQASSFKAEPKRPVEAPQRRIDSSNKPVSISGLNNKVCHWPMGGFADRPPFMYCGDPAVTGNSYCLRHFKLSSSRLSKETADETKLGAVAA